MQSWVKHGIHERDCRLFKPYTPPAFTDSSQLLRTVFLKPECFVVWLLVQVLLSRILHTYCFLKTKIEMSATRRRKYISRFISLGLMAPSAEQSLGSVLLICGCGFVGFHVVHAFLHDPRCTSVSVISRNPNCNRLSGVSYYACDISSPSTLLPLINRIQPTVIIHAATPSPVSYKAKIFESVNIQGTRNLLNAASSVHAVKAFIFTSTTTVVAGAEHIELDETAPLADTDPKASLYAKTKALADKMVLEANRPREKIAAVFSRRASALRSYMAKGTNSPSPNSWRH